MKKIFPFLLLLTIAGSSCSSASKNIFGNKSPHEKYAEKLDKTDIEETPEGRQWLAAAATALANPYTIAVPYKQRGYFQPDKPRALGLQFAAKAGERISFQLTKDAAANFVLYADVYKQNGTTTQHLLSSDTNTGTFYVDIAEAGNYVVRLQPELYRTGEYSFSITSGPSLAFPVTGTANIGSFWGAARDGGKRSHEGIDIFAKKLTPVVAAEDGYVTGVKEGGIGGKTVWMNVAGKDIYLYYAHLDQQLVQQGQEVKRGDVLGLVGNTGNAKHTPAHLHFGVYTSNGPIDPFSFVNRTIKEAASVPDKKLTAFVKLIKDQKTDDGLLKMNTMLVPLAVTAKGYLVELPLGGLLTTPFAAVQVIKEGAKLADAFVTRPGAATKKS